MPIHRCLAIALLVVPAWHVSAQQKPLDHADYAKWSAIRAPLLSSDGKWLAYTQTPFDADGALFVLNLKDGRLTRIERGAGAAFTKDGSTLTYSILPPKADTEKARKEKKPAPKPHFAALDLADGQTFVFEKATGFRFPADNGNWYAVQYAPAEGKKDFAVEFRNTASKSAITLQGLLEFVFDSRALGAACALNGKGVIWIDLTSEKRTLISEGKGRYANLAVDKLASRIAYTFEPTGDQKPKASLRVWSQGRTLELAADRLPSGFELSEQPSSRFSDDGKRLFFKVSPAKDDSKNPPGAGEEAAVLDVWHYRDPLIQPEQILKASSSKTPTYLAVWHLAQNAVAMLETPELATVSTLAKGDGDWAIGFSSAPYDIESTWTNGFRDVYRVNVKTGEKELILKKFQGTVLGSPTGRYASWYDRESRHYFVYDLEKGGSPVNVTREIPAPLWSALSGTPGEPAPYGSAGWTKGDKEMLVYDQYDVWAVDPTGKSKPRCVTDGFGRRWGIVLRLQKLDPDEESVDPSRPLLLSALRDADKASGFYRGSLSGAAPAKLVMDDRDFGDPIKAAQADTVVVSRQSFREYPDLYLTDLSFSQLKRLTDANPQQKDYLWGSNELVQWLSGDGEKLSGILVKPANFDPSMKYPMVVYFYERMSTRLHTYASPAPVGSAAVNPSFMASRGYLVFLPDVKYSVGYPGPSAASAIVPGVLSLLAKGFVDPARIGIVGHSWGGYQTAFLVTQTNLFRCAIAGAAVTNMTSAYSGIRWGSGKMRQFQYEVGQSRIGGSLWQYPLQFIENSPVFWADRVNTPILLLHNDKDGAVPFEQSIEFYGALRRFGKPVWLVNYNGEEHGIAKMPNRKDWTIRITQFLDHFLKGEPAPVWLAKGIPASKKGQTFGLEPAGR